MNEIGPLEEHVLPPGIRARFVDNTNGLAMHVLEAGRPSAPLVLLLHGFPELAYSWRKVMPALAAARYYVIAPDQRGYGRTLGWDPDYDGDLGSFRILNLVRDTLGLVSALGYRAAEAVVGHDFGSSVAEWCALIRPDVFRSVVLMSAPFGGAPELPFHTAGKDRVADTRPSIHDELAALGRKHYQWYYSEREANADMWRAPQGVHAFLRAYYHHKSGGWPGNRPYRLAGWTAGELAKLPTYYIMELDKGMAETVAPFMPSAAEIAACKWLTEAEVAVYATEFGRTQFTGALQGYRVRRGSDPKSLAEMRTFTNRSIDVPSMFVGGKSDWGTYQTPGAVDRMRTTACTRMVGFHLLEGAGHWVQQEQPEQVSALLIQFLREQRT